MTKFPYTLYEIITLEFYLLLGLFAAGTYLFYKFFLKNVSKERHEGLQDHHKNIFYHFILLSVLYFLFQFFYFSLATSSFSQSAAPYVASFTYIAGVIVLIKTCRLFVLQYLFLGSMRAGVPLLLVNIFSLALVTGILFWTLSKLFQIDLTPVVATSAAFSIVLGLAMQDTLGNLFAGISLQVDRTFEIDDWLEVQNGLVKIVGQVKEQTWRSTMLVGLSDEMITLPNKLIASCQVSNFSPNQDMIVRGQTFRIKLTDDIAKAKDILEQGACQISDVLGIPSPYAYVQEITENWVSIKVIYFIQNYGNQFVVGDKVLSTCLTLLHQNGFKTAHQTVEYKNEFSARS